MKKKLKNPKKKQDLELPGWEMWELTNLATGLSDKDASTLHCLLCIRLGKIVSR
jgi:hypothetical protein